MLPRDMRIEHLANHPEAIPTLAAWERAEPIRGR